MKYQISKIKYQRSKVPEQSAGQRIFGVNKDLQIIRQLTDFRSRQNCNSKFLSFQIFILVLIFEICALRLSATAGRAQEMQSQNFRVSGGNFNMTSGNKASQNFKLSDVVGQTAAGIFASKGYIIQAGFMNAAAGGSIAFSVIPDVVDFGTLIPNNPVEKSLRITVSNGEATGYTVKVWQNQPLSTLVGATVPDTVCDGVKNTPCTFTQSAKWSDTGAYGFGYKIEGRTVPSDFAKESFYRPFPATRRNDSPIVIMNTQAKKVVDQATMTLRVNVSQNQPVGQYRNVLSFSAVAGI